MEVVLGPGPQISMLGSLVTFMATLTRTWYNSLSRSVAFFELHKLYDTYTITSLNTEYVDHVFNIGFTQTKRSCQRVLHNYGSLTINKSSTELIFRMVV